MPRRVPYNRLFGDRDGPTPSNQPVPNDVPKDVRVTRPTGDRLLTTTDFGLGPNQVARGSEIQKLKNKAGIGAKVLFLGSQELPDATNTHIEFNTVVFDDAGFWDAANNQFIIPSGLGGLYMLQATLAYGTNSTGSRGCNIDVNGIRVDSMWLRANSDNHNARVTVTPVERVNDGDTVNAVGYQDRGLPLNIVGTASNITRFSLARIGA